MLIRTLRLVTVLIVSILLTMTFGAKTYAQDDYGENLVVNGDAEKDAIPDDADSGDTPSGWTSLYGAFTAVTPNNYYWVTQYPIYGPGITSNFFVGGRYTDFSVMTQQIDLTKFHDEITTGNVRAFLDARIGGWANQSDYTIISADFVDGAGNYISTLSLPATDNFVYRDLNGDGVWDDGDSYIALGPVWGAPYYMDVPKNAASVFINVTGVRQEGDDCDSYVDDVTFYVKKKVDCVLEGPFVKGQSVAGTTEDPVIPGEEVMFDGSKSRDSNGSSVEDYKWQIVSPSGEYSEQTDPQIFFTAVEKGQWTVVLTVRSLDGSEATKTKSFTVALPNYKVKIDTCDFTGKGTHSVLTFRIEDSVQRYTSIANYLEVVAHLPNGGFTILTRQIGPIEEGNSYSLDFTVPTDIDTGNIPVEVVVYRRVGDPSDPDYNYNASDTASLSVQFDPLHTNSSTVEAAVFYPQLLPPFIGVGTHDVQTEVSVDTRTWQWVAPSAGKEKTQVWSLGSRITTNLPAVISFADTFTKTAAHWYIEGVESPGNFDERNTSVTVNNGELSYWRVRSFAQDGIFDAKYAGATHFGETHDVTWYTRYRIVDQTFTGFSIARIIYYLWEHKKLPKGVSPVAAFEILSTIVLFDPYKENIRVDLN